MLPAALAEAPGVGTVLTVDLAPYLAPPLRWIVPLIRPKNPATHKARILPFNASCAAQPSDRLIFADSAGDRVAAYFHTGGTTGMPKVAQHKYSGMIYNGWLGAEMLFDETDVLMCPLPMFHVFAAYPVLMSCLASGAQLTLIDEPVAGLDRASIRYLCQALADTAQAPDRALVVAHYEALDGVPWRAVIELPELD